MSLFLKALQLDVADCLSYIHLVISYRADSVFGLQNLSPDSDELIVVEDEVDALVIRQKTGRNVIAVSRLKGMMIPQQVRSCFNVATSSS